MQRWIGHHLPPLLSFRTSGIKACSVTGPAVTSINEGGEAGSRGDGSRALPGIAAIVSGIKDERSAPFVSGGHRQNALCRREKVWRCNSELSGCLRWRKTQGLRVPCLSSIARSVEKAITRCRVTPGYPASLLIEKGDARFLAPKWQATRTRQVCRCRERCGDQCPALPAIAAAQNMRRLGVLRKLVSRKKPADLWIDEGDLCHHAGLQRDILPALHAIAAAEKLGGTAATPR